MSGDLVQKWGALALAAGALFWAAAASWGRLDLQAGHLVELQRQLALDATAVQRLTTRMETYAEERTRILAGVNGHLAELDESIAELRRETQALRERLAARP
jgi:hypothetical protein